MAYFFQQVGDEPVDDDGLKVEQDQDEEDEELEDQV